MGGWQKYLQAERTASHHFLVQRVNNLGILPGQHLWAEAISERLLQFLNSGVVEPESMDDNNLVILVQRV